MPNQVLRQPNEALSGLPYGGTLTCLVTGLWHVDAYVTGTAGFTLQAITPTATVSALLAVPGTNAATTVASVIVHFAIPVIQGNAYTLSGTGMVIVSGAGVILPA